jgi:hypothetical protein
MAEPAKSLLELEKCLREKDAILERNTLQTLREYVAAGGKPATAIDLLSDNYRGARRCARGRGARRGCGGARLRRNPGCGGGAALRAALRRWARARRAQATRR